MYLYHKATCNKNTVENSSLSNKEVASHLYSLCYCSFAASVPAILPEYTFQLRFSPAEKCTVSRTCALSLTIRPPAVPYTIEWLQDDRNVTAEELAAFEYRIMPEIIKQAFSFKT